MSMWSPPSQQCFVMCHCPTGLSWNIRTIFIFNDPFALSSWTSPLCKTLVGEVLWLTNSPTLNSPWKAKENTAENKAHSKSFLHIQGRTLDIPAKIVFVIGSLLSAVCLKRFIPCNTLHAKNSEVGS
jgi:hypothetical protein